MSWTKQYWTVFCILFPMFYVKEPFEYGTSVLDIMCVIMVVNYHNYSWSGWNVGIFYWTLPWPSNLSSLMNVFGWRQNQAKFLSISWTWNDFQIKYCAENTDNKKNCALFHKKRSHCIELFVLPELISSNIIKLVTKLHSLLMSSFCLTCSMLYSP